MCLTGNAYPHQKRGYASSGMHIFAGNGDVLHQECIYSPRMHIVYTGWPLEDNYKKVIYTPKHFCPVELMGKKKRHYILRVNGQITNYKLMR